MKQSVRVGLSLALLIGALLVLHLRSSSEAVPIRKSLDSFPNTVGQWQAREGVLLDLDTLNVLRPKDYLMRRDQDRWGRSVFVFIAYWDSQRKGAQPHSPKNCLPGAAGSRSRPRWSRFPSPPLRADHGEPVPDTEGSGPADCVLLVPVPGESDRRRDGRPGADGEGFDSAAPDRWGARASLERRCTGAYRTLLTAWKRISRPCTLF